MNVRPIGPGDAEAIGAIAAEDEAAVHARVGSRLGVGDVRTWLTRVDLENDSWIFEEGERIVGVGWIAFWRLHATFGGVAAPGWKGRGIGTEILRRAETRARARGAARLHGFAYEADAAAHELFEGNGYSAVRRFYEMAIELTEAPVVPALPAGLVLDAVGPDEYRAFHAALDDAFGDHWEWHPMAFDEWLEMRRDQHEDARGPLWFVVRDGDEIAAIVRNEADRNGGGYVGSLGVRPAWRGRGLAKALLFRTFAEFHGRGDTRVTLGVDAESPTGATHLYESVGMEVETCSVVYEKIPS